MSNIGFRKNCQVSLMVYRVRSKYCHLLQFSNVSILLPDGVNQCSSWSVVSNFIQLVHFFTVLERNVICVKHGYKLFSQKLYRPFCTVNSKY